MYSSFRLRQDPLGDRVLDPWQAHRTAHIERQVADPMAERQQRLHGGQLAGPGCIRQPIQRVRELLDIADDDWLPTEAIDEQLTDAVMDYWVQFARTGDPNSPGRPTWPLYRAEKPAVLELGEKIQTVPPADAALCIWLGPQ